MKKVIFVLTVVLITTVGAYAAPPGNLFREKIVVQTTAFNKEIPVQSMRPDMPDVGAVVLRTNNKEYCAMHVIRPGGLKVEEIFSSNTISQRTEAGAIVVENDKPLNLNRKNTISLEDDPLEIVLSNNKEAEEIADVAPTRKTANPVVYQNNDESANQTIKL